MDQYPSWDPDHEGLTYGQGLKLAGFTTGIFATGVTVITGQIGAQTPYQGSYIEVPRVLEGKKRLRSDVPEVFSKQYSRKKRKVLLRRLRKVRNPKRGWCFVWRT